ncbi:MAG: hypothetical protein RLZ12_871 [Bacillota bacterium]
MAVLLGTDLINKISQFAPASLALPGDSIGLQVGSPCNEVDGVLFTLDVTIQVLQEAVSLGANWILAHHPLLYRPFEQVDTESPVGQMIKFMLLENLNLYVAHSNLDITTGGVNDVLASSLGLVACKPLISTFSEPSYKLVVFLPKDHYEPVFQNLAAAGAGLIGRYSHCAFAMEGQGSFKPLEGSNPLLGHVGVLEQATELRLEMIVPKRCRKKVIETLLATHPYEEVAYDLYQLNSSLDKYGLGRIGKLNKTMAMPEFIEYVKKVFGVCSLRSVGSLQRDISKVAILGGSGAKYLRKAQEMGADLFITGDIGYHAAQEALALNFLLLDPGHHIEYLVLKSWREQINLPDNVVSYISKVKWDPFNWHL